MDTFAGLHGRACCRCRVIELLVVDRHTLVRKGIVALLSGNPELHVAAECSTAEEALEVLSDRPVDVALIDIALSPKVRDGMDLIGKIRSGRPQVHILVLTMHSESDYAARALRAGANGYVTKDMTPETLVEAVRRVAAGGRYLSPNVAESLALRAVLQDEVAPAHRRLSPREMAVFDLLVDGHSISEIANSLALSAKTVSAHRLSLLRKLNLGSVAELVRYAIAHELTAV